MHIRIGIIGLGRIARESHIPALLRSPQFRLVAGADPAARNGWSFPVFRGGEELIRALGSELDAVAICTPPQFRAAIAEQCIKAGIHLLLEKPPAASLGEVQALVELAAANSVRLYFSWHSRMNEAVKMAQGFLEDLEPWSFEASWREDPDVWHAGQDWIWKPAGLGVFDAGINALSILTTLSRSRWLVKSADLHHVVGRSAPTAAMLRLATSSGSSGTLMMEWKSGIKDLREIAIRAGQCRLELKNGGVDLGGALRHCGDGAGEYDRLYERFGNLIEQGQSELDYEPLRIVSDAFLLGSHVTVAT